MPSFGIAEDMLLNWKSLSQVQNAATARRKDGRKESGLSENATSARRKTTLGKLNLFAVRPAQKGVVVMNRIFSNATSAGKKGGNRERDLREMRPAQ
jgi:hypothetical protein